MKLVVRDVRAGGDGVLGTPAHAIVAPETLDEAAAALRGAAERGQSVAFLGGGTELGLGYPPRRVDLLLKTTRLARIVEHAPFDLVVEVEAGITLSMLQRALEPHGQRLALDPPHPELATVGGLVATNAFGPRRMRYGGLRDLIVGVSLLRADGVRVRGGGKVVKNVAGFDLPKLAVGSLGTLGMIATATFRLHPLPESATLLRVGGCDAAQVRRIARELLARQFEPAAFTAERTDGGYACAVLFEGFAQGVDDQAERFERLAADLGFATERPDDPGAAGLRDEAIRTRGDVRVRCSAPPAAFDLVERDVLAPLASALDEAAAVCYPAVGAAFLSAYLRDAERAAAAFARARAAVEALGGNLVLLDARDRDFARRVDVYGAVPGSFALMRNLKDRFDPSHRLNAGRFIGGL